MKTHSATIFTAFAAAILFAGCPASDKDSQSYNDAPENTDAHGHDEHHHETGPHGGHVIELTEDESLHGELAYDPQSRTITFYVLGADLESPVSVGLDAVLLHLEDSDDEIAMTPAPQAGDEEGKSSMFTLNGDKVPAEIDDVEKIHGHVHVTVDGKEYTGDIEHDHDGEDHDHDAEHHDDDDDDDHKGAESEAGSKPE